MHNGDVREVARDARRQTILNVARDVFIAEGFAETSMSAIAARVGGSKGTLYNYFPSKQDLFAAVIRDQCERKLTAMFGSLLAEGDDIYAVLRAVGRRYTHLILSEDAMLLSRVVIAEVGRFPELGQVMYEAGPKRGRMRLAAYVETQMQAGRLRRADTTRLVEQFFDMCLSSFYRRLLNVTPPPSESEVGEKVDSAVDVLMAAYAPEQAPTA